MVCDETEKIEKAGNRAKNQTGGNMFGRVSTIISCNITCRMKVYITRTPSSFFLERSCYQMVYHKTEGSGLRYKHLCMHRAVSGELEAKLKRT